jgi:putative SOS response-associated peptidase YedK
VQPQDGVITHSFTLLTVNADGHAIMGRMHRPGDEKRMPVIIRPPDYIAWLQASPQQAMDFMQTFEAQAMSAKPAPRAAPVRVPRANPEARNLPLF